MPGKLPPNRGGGQSEIEPVETWNGVLRDRRELELRNAGVVVKHTITGPTDEAVKFQLVDPLLSHFEVEDVGFHPDFEPDHGRIDGEQAVISGVVEPDEPSVVRYGARLRAGPSLEEIKEIQTSSLPSIELSEQVGSQKDADSELEEAAIPRSTSAAGGITSGSDGFLADMEWGRPSGADADRDEDEAISEAADDDTDAPVEASEPSESADADESPFSWETIGSGQTASTEGDAEATDPEADDSDGESTADEEPAEEASGTRKHAWGQGDPFGHTEEDSSLAAALSRKASDQDAESGSPVLEDEDAPADSGPEPETQDTGRPAEDSGGDDTAVDVDAEGTGRLDDPVEALIRQLEDGDVSDEQTERLAAALDRLLETAETTTESTRLRLERLESRMQSFSTYIDALEAIIDEHGPADEFLGEVRADIRSLETTVDRIDDELQQAAEARDSIDDRLDALDDQTSLLESRLERLGDRLDSMRSSHRSKLSALEDQIERLEPAAEQVEDLEAAVEQLSADVEAAEARRRAIVQALSDVDEDE